MAYTEQDIELAMVAHDCARQEAIDNGYAQAVADHRAAQRAEYELADLRRERDRLLLETDYWVLSDTATATQAQLDYRQALRDITNTYSSILTVVWPTKP